MRNKSYKSQLKIRRNKKRLVIVVTLMAIGGLTTVLYLKYHRTSTAVPTIQTNTTTFTPPASIDQNKPQETTTDSKTSTNQPVNTSKNKSSKIVVAPTILSADKNGLNGFVSGIFEDGGICTAVFTRASQDITVSTTAFSNASYTSCAPIKLSSPINISGNWSVVLKYSSTTADGSSSPYLFKVE